MSNTFTLRHFTTNDPALSDSDAYTRIVADNGNAIDQAEALTTAFRARDSAIKNLTPNIVPIVVSKTAPVLQKINFVQHTAILTFPIKDSDAPGTISTQDSLDFLDNNGNSLASRSSYEIESTQVTMSALSNNPTAWLINSMGLKHSAHFSVWTSREVPENAIALGSSAQKASMFMNIEVSNVSRRGMYFGKRLPCFMFKLVKRTNSTVSFTDAESRRVIAEAIETGAVSKTTTFAIFFDNIDTLTGTVAKIHEHYQESTRSLREFVNLRSQVKSSVTTFKNARGGNLTYMKVAFSTFFDNWAFNTIAGPSKTGKLAVDAYWGREVYDDDFGDSVLGDDLPFSLADTSIFESMVPHCKALYRHLTDRNVYIIDAVEQTSAIMNGGALNDQIGQLIAEYGFDESENDLVNAMLMINFMFRNNLIIASNANELLAAHGANSSIEDQEGNNAHMLAESFDHMITNLKSTIASKLEIDIADMQYPFDEYTVEMSTSLELVTTDTCLLTYNFTVPASDAGRKLAKEITDHMRTKLKTYDTSSLKTYPKYMTGIKDTAVRGDLITYYCNFEYASPGDAARAVIMNHITIVHDVRVFVSYYTTEPPKQLPDGTLSISDLKYREGYDPRVTPSWLPSFSTAMQHARLARRKSAIAKSSGSGHRLSIYDVGGYENAHELKITINKCIENPTPSSFKLVETLEDYQFAFGYINNFTKISPAQRTKLINLLNQRKLEILLDLLRKLATEFVADEKIRESSEEKSEEFHKAAGKRRALIKATIGDVLQLEKYIPDADSQSIATLISNVSGNEKFKSHVFSVVKTLIESSRKVKTGTVKIEKAKDTNSTGVMFFNMLAEMSKRTIVAEADSGDVIDYYRKKDMDDYDDIVNRFVTDGTVTCAERLRALKYENVYKIANGVFTLRAKESSKSKKEYSQIESRVATIFEDRDLSPARNHQLITAISLLVSRGTGLYGQTEINEFMSRLGHVLTVHKIESMPHFEEWRQMPNIKSFASWCHEHKLPTSTDYGTLNLSVPQATATFMTAVQAAVSDRINSRSVDITSSAAQDDSLELYLDVWRRPDFFAIPIANPLKSRDTYLKIVEKCFIDEFKSPNATKIIDKRFLEALCEFASFDSKLVIQERSHAGFMQFLKEAQVVELKDLKTRLDKLLVDQKQAQELLTNLKSQELELQNKLDQIGTGKDTKLLRKSKEAELATVRHKITTFVSADQIDEQVEALSSIIAAVESGAPDSTMFRTKLVEYCYSKMSTVNARGLAAKFLDRFIDTIDRILFVAATLNGEYVMRESASSLEQNSDEDVPDNCSEQSSGLLGIAISSCGGDVDDSAQEAPDRAIIKKETVTANQFSYEPDMESQSKNFFYGKLI